MNSMPVSKPIWLPLLPNCAIKIKLPVAGPSVLTLIVGNADRKSEFTLGFIISTNDKTL